MPHQIIMEEKKKKLYPLLFEQIASEKLGEGSNCSTYLLADLGYIDSVVSNGWLSGTSISDIMETYLDRVVGDNVYYFYGRQFPLSIKWIDSKEKSPLMVCPDDRIANERYDALGKKKLWYIVDAQPSAKLYLGFKETVSASDFYHKCVNGSIGDALNEVVPHNGDFFQINPGTVHAASGGLKIIEIAESSDLDLNISAWRMATEEDELNIEAAIDFVDMGRYLAPESSGGLHDDRDKVTDKLAVEDEFAITRLALKDSMHIYTEQFGAFLIYLCVSGKASLQVRKDSEEEGSRIDNYVISAGEAILVPAELPDFILAPMEADTVLLEATVPHREEKDDEYINKDAEPFLEGEDYSREGDFDDGIDEGPAMRARRFDN